ncbi:TetR/AcrR family transcriptional regulator [Nocardioides litoris]|uniref:TetR/AcrR family transcriptional regulator n=1 Tax=Nocardioides litoris TaxID=1926648 RepID=UPI001120D581|nr:TetR/AcrR family transcriptional regulator [Nocardioides litoris]
MTTSTDPGKQLTARGLRTRKLLLDAGRRVFERDGFAAARITDIADLAGVAHGTFYTYFESKDVMFVELIDSVREEMLAGSAHTVIPEAEEGEEPWQTIARANRRYLTAYRENAQLMVIWEQAATMNDASREMLTDSRQRFAERSAKAIRRYQQAGVADPDLDPTFAAVALGAMVSRFAYIWFAGREPHDFEDAVTQLTVLWCNAIRIPRGASA